MQWCHCSSSVGMLTSCPWSFCRSKVACKKENGASAIVFFYVDTVVSGGHLRIRYNRPSVWSKLGSNCPVCTPLIPGHKDANHNHRVFLTGGGGHIYVDGNTLHPLKAFLICALGTSFCIGYYIIMRSSYYELNLLSRDIRLTAPGIF